MGIYKTQSVGIFCSKMQQNASETAKIEVQLPASSQSIYTSVINSWLCACWVTLVGLPCQC